MATNPTAQLLIELDPRADVVSGALHGPDGSRRPFHGWLALMAAIEHAHKQVRDETP